MIYFVCYVIVWCFVMLEFDVDGIIMFLILCYDDIISYIVVCKLKLIIKKKDNWILYEGLNN